MNYYSIEKTLGSWRASKTACSIPGSANDTQLENVRKSIKIETVCLMNSSNLYRQKIYTSIQPIKNLEL